MKVTVLVTRSYLTGSCVYRISQARILELVAITFSRGSFWVRDWTWISCIAGGFFTIWATREAPHINISYTISLVYLSIYLSIYIYPYILDYILAAAAAKSLQSCPTLCDPIDGSPPDSPFPGILQARTLEWVAISFSNPWKWKVKVKSFSRVRVFATPWTAAYQAPPSMGFSRQEYRSGLPLQFIFPSAS